MTKDGFVLAVMAFTGKKALGFKIEYIEELNRKGRNERQRLIQRGLGKIARRQGMHLVSDTLKNELDGIDVISDFLNHRDFLTLAFFLAARFIFHRWDCSLACSISLIILGFAWSSVSFMTCPMKNPNNPVFPD